MTGLVTGSYDNMALMSSSLFKKEKRIKIVLFSRNKYIQQP